MLWCLVELVFYVHNKAQAKLFLTLKVSDLQQKQLFSLLDTVPDMVLLC